MTSHIAQGSRSKIPIASPVKWHIALPVFLKFCRTEPKIPIQFRWYRSCCFWFSKALRPYWSVSPHNYCMRIANDAGIIPFLHLPDTVTAGTLVTHLCNYFVFPCIFCKEPCFINIMRQWFLCVHMLA